MAIEDILKKARQTSSNLKTVVKVLATSVTLKSGKVYSNEVKADKLVTDTVDIKTQSSTIDGKDIKIFVKPKIKLNSEVTVKNLKDTPLYDDTKVKGLLKQIQVELKSLDNSKEHKEYKQGIEKQTKQLQGLDKLLEELKQAINKKMFELKNIQITGSDEPTDYIPVRLTNGKEFYEGLQSIIAGGGILNFIDTGGTVRRALTDTDGHLQVDVLNGGGGTFDDYEYMGKQESGNYVYYGFKKYGGTDWKVMRKDTTDDSAWKYAYGTSGWSTAWASPGSQSYGDPPDS